MSTSTRGRALTVAVRTVEVAGLLCGLAFLWAVWPPLVLAGLCALGLSVGRLR